MANRSRGYVLIEVMVGGALFAVLVSVLLTQLAEARTRNVIAGRDVVAAQLVQEQLGRERAAGYAGTPSATCNAAFAAVASQTGKYERKCEVVNGTRTVGSAATQTLNVNTVTVTVRYDNSADGVRTIAAATEIYQ